MKKFCLLIPLLAALPTAWGCAGTKPVQSAAGEGGSGAIGSGGAGNVGNVGSGGATTSGTGGSLTTTGDGGGGGDVSPNDAGEANCGLQQFKPTPKAADILMVLDRSGSMIDIPDGAPSGSTTTKWEIVVPSLEAVVSATQSSISWGMKSFPEAYTDSMDDCQGGVTSAIDVKVAAMDGTQMNSAITALTPAGKGTPTADAITQGASYLATLTDTNPKYLLLATDGEPTCVGTTKDSTNAGPAAVNAIAAALTAGFPTFVVGIATSKASDNTELTAMSKAGGEPIPVTNPLAYNYYIADDATTLVSAMEAITGQISTCLFPLSPAPPVRNDPTKLGVYVGSGMTRIPYDATNGWTYTDLNDTAVEVHGSWCNMIEAAGAGAVQIIFGCPSINPPG
ncbi:MAG TPA: vWA domain-containing protein [Polyangia bacterium]|nr:vWA domain-containing protein [Polyangia bacterium]